MIFLTEYHALLLSPLPPSAALQIEAVRIHQRKKSRKNSALFLYFVNNILHFAFNTHPVLKINLVIILCGESVGVYVRVV